MAIASGSWMGAKAAYGSTLAGKLDKIDCSQVLAAVLKADRAILGHIKMGETGKNIQFDWVEDELNEVTFEACCSDSTSVSVPAGFTGTVSLAKIVRDGAVITMKNRLTGYASTENSYYLLVSSASAATELTTTLYGSIPHVVATTTATWIVVSQPWSDSDDASSDITRIRAKKHNFMQIFERAIEISQTRKGMDMEAVTSELQHQIKYRTLEVKRELNISVLTGMAYSASGLYRGDTEARSMMGIINYIRNPTLADGTGTLADTTVTSEAGAALTVAKINSILYKIWSEGGLDDSADPIIVVGAPQQRAIAAMEKDIRRVEQGERQVGYYRDVFLSDMGSELPIVMDRWMADDKLLILDRSRVALRALQGDGWHMEKMAKTGRSEKWQLSGQYGIELRNPDKCHGLIHNLA
jgi:hypothetical protein